jgi:hypothetical protein
MDMIELCHLAILSVFRASKLRRLLLRC